MWGVQFPHFWTCNLMETIRDRPNRRDHWNDQEGSPSYHIGGLLFPQNIVEIQQKMWLWLYGICVAVQVGFYWNV